eukprot:gene4586-20853_t
MSGVGRTVALLGRTSIRARAFNPALRGGVENAPGNNMPFQTSNKPRLLATMVGFLGLGFAIPFIAVRFQMHKKASS